jgi:hypothetical protein
MVILRVCCAPPKKKRSAPLPRRSVIRKIAALLALLSPVAALAQPATPISSAPTTGPIIDNERVTVRDITLAAGRHGVTVKHDQDFATLFLVGGTVRTTGPDGKDQIAARKAGEAVFHQRGTETDQAISGHPRLIVVDLKDVPAAPMTNRSGYPPAFPRPGSKKMLENDRVIVWNYAWVPGRPTPMHYHDKDVVVVYRESGTLDSVTPDGKHTKTAHRFGEIRFNKGARSHYELLMQGHQSAIMMELK